MDILCIGCMELKLEAELSKYKEELLCESCRNQEKLMDEFSKLELQEAKLIDDIIELESNLHRARQNIRQKEKLVQEARQRYRDNELKMAKFDWSREIVSN